MSSALLAILVSESEVPVTGHRLLQAFRVASWHVIVWIRVTTPIKAWVLGWRHWYWP